MITDAFYLKYLKPLTSIIQRNTLTDYFFVLSAKVND